MSNTLFSEASDALQGIRRRKKEEIKMSCLTKEEKLRLLVNLVVLK